MSDEATRSKQRAAALDQDEATRMKAVRAELREGTWQAIECPWCRNRKTDITFRTNVPNDTPFMAKSPDEDLVSWRGGCDGCGGGGLVRVRLEDLPTLRIPFRASPPPLLDAP